MSPTVAANAPIAVMIVWTSIGITVLMLSFDRTYPSNNVTRPIVLEYATNASAEKGYRDEAGVVAKAYAAAVADGYQPRGLSATAFDSDRQPVASYRVERSWASAYASGGLSGQKYGQRIGETYQSFGGDSTQAAGYEAGTAHRLDDKVGNSPHMLSNSLVGSLTLLVGKVQPSQHQTS